MALGYSDESGNTISKFKINPVKHFGNNVYTIYLNKYVAESIVETKTATITLTNVSPDSFYTYLNCDNVKLSYGIYTKNNPNKLEPCELRFKSSEEPFVGLTDVLKYNGELVKKAILSNNERTVSGINYLSVNSPLFGLDYMNGSDIYGLPIYVRDDTTAHPDGYLNGNLYVKKAGELRLFKVYKNINSGKLINLTHFENNKRSEDKYCYAVESKDSNGNSFYQILGFNNITQYFGNLTNNDRYYGDMYEVEQGTPQRCFEIATSIINNAFTIGCFINKSIDENTLTDNNSNYRVFFNNDECVKLNERLQRGYSQAISNANSSSSTYDPKIIIPLGS